MRVNVPETPLSNPAALGALIAIRALRDLCSEISRSAFAQQQQQPDTLLGEP